MVSKGERQGEGYYSAAWSHGGLAAGVEVAPTIFNTLKYSYIHVLGYHVQYTGME